MLITPEARTFTPLYTNGLAIPPVLINCYGEDCPVAASEGSCYSDKHHLYHSLRAYLGHPDPVYTSLRNDPINIITMAKCRHIDEHNRYKFTPFPKKDIAVRLLDESSLLAGLGVSCKWLADALQTIEETYAVEERASPGQLGRLVELHDPIRTAARGWAQHHEESLQVGLALVGEIEVVPDIILAGTLAHITQKRASLPFDKLLAA